MCESLTIWSALLEANKADQIVNNSRMLTYADVC